MNPLSKRDLAPRPPLGWNSYDSYRNDLHEEETLENLEIFARDLAPHGYAYFTIDLGWYSEVALIPGTHRPAGGKILDWKLDAWGYPVGSSTYFPGGMKRIADRAHELGVKFGLHLMRGMIKKAWDFNLPVKGTGYRMRDIADRVNTCKWCDFTWGVDMSKPGAQAYYDGLIEHMAAMGVDLIKYDDLVPHPAELEAIGKAVAKCSRPIVLSLSPGNDTTQKNRHAYEWGHLLRISGDVWDSRDDLEKCFRRWEEWQGAGRGGFWPDLDMLCVGTLTKGIDPADDFKPVPFTTEGLDLDRLDGHFFRECRFTPAQERTFLTMRALAASPLFMGGCLKRTPRRVFDLITHPDLLACNQNGVTGSLVHKGDGIEIWHTPRSTGEYRGWIGVFNRQKTEGVKISPADPRFPKIVQKGAVKDLWRGRILRGNEPVEIEGDDVLFLEYGPA